MRALVLFTRDLRVHDHPALTDACRTADEVLPVFVLEPRLLARSPNRARFLVEALADLDGSLRRLRGRLIVREGDVVAQTRSLAGTNDCRVVHVTTDASEYGQGRERELARALGPAGIELRATPGHAIVEPGAVSTARGGAYRVFTPYWRAWKGVSRRGPLPVPPRIAVPRDLDPGSRLDPSSVPGESPDLPLGGETAGRRCLEAFLRSEAATYRDGRNDLAADVTSRLSPYLRFGCISANELASRAAQLPGGDEFLRQLSWRDFFLQLLAEKPELARKDMRPGTSVPTPIPADVALEAWREGSTGLPLVDAGMRQLRREGWMHNRARLVVASFLTRRLGMPWQEGARHFARWLVDGDPASNSGNWQWVAGTGTDPRRTRAFNPVLQARRYDPTGEYVRRYVRELAGVRDARIFAPWVDPDLIAATGYPEPIIPVPVRR